MKNVLSGLVWVILYLFFCLAPLVLALGQNRPPGRPFLVEFSVALGFVGLSILALQFALIARFKVNSLIVTLAMMEVVRGLAYITSSGDAVTPNAVAFTGIALTTALMEGCRA